MGKSRAKGPFHIQNHRAGGTVLTNGKRPKFNIAFLHLPKLK